MEAVPDRASPRLAGLDATGRIRERSRAIFGTGDRLGVITVTANGGFVRAARGRGVHLAAVVHESRALAEDKMAKVVQEEEIDLCSSSPTTNSSILPSCKDETSDVAVPRITKKTA